MVETNTARDARIVAVAAVGGLGAILHGAVAVDSLFSVVFYNSDVGPMFARLVGFSLLALASAATVVLALRSPRRWMAALFAAVVLLALAFTDLRTLGLTTV